MKLRHQLILKLSVLLSGVFLLIGNSSLTLAAGSGDSGASSETPAVVVEAEKAIKKGQFDKAYEMLAAKESKYSKNADLYNLMGYSARKMQRYDDSMAHYLRALEINPKHKGALEYIGELYLTLNQPDDAKAMLAKLEKVCFLGCDEKTELAEAISAWEAQNN
jgi:tetratricopeptide (TPR) repeat protein